MARRPTPRRLAEPGDTFAERLEDGRWGAVRVLRTICKDTVLVAVTAYIGAAPPAPDDALLRRVQTFIWYGDPDTPCACWYQGPPPSELEWLARIPPTTSERQIGGKDAGWGFGGRWRPGTAWSVLRAWQWTHERAEFDAWQRGLDPPTVAVTRAAPMMTEARFWSLVKLIARDHRDEDAGLRELVAALAKMSAANIRGFDERLATMLHRLDARVFAEQIGRHAFRDAKTFSVDNFLYARCEAVARGRAFFQHVLRAPKDMPKEATFEPLLFVAQRAYETKTGRTYEYVPHTPYETFSNSAGWS